MIFQTLISPMLAAVLLAAQPASDPQIDAMGARFAAAAESMRSRGIDPVDYYARLGLLERRVTSVPANAPAEMLADLQTQKSLEFQLDDRLISGQSLALPKVGDAAVRLYASTGKAPDPIGVYVPQPDTAGHFALVVLLHGAQQTESDVISRGVFRHLADTNHAILIAPYNGGHASWRGSEISDLMTLVDKVCHLYTVDARHIYLIGMSMGGASVFRIAAEDGDRFAAVMTIVGALDPHDAALARLALRDRPVYMVSGGADPIMTPAAEARSYSALTRGCVAVTQYVAASAGHDLYATSGQVDRAWNDMFSGVIRSSVTRECGEMPGTAP